MLNKQIILENHSSEHQTAVFDLLNDTLIKEYSPNISNCSSQNFTPLAVAIGPDEFLIRLIAYSCSSPNDLHEQFMKIVKDKLSDPTAQNVLEAIYEMQIATAGFKMNRQYFPDCIEFVNDKFLENLNAQVRDVNGNTENSIRLIPQSYFSPYQMQSNIIEMKQITIKPTLRKLKAIIPPNSRLIFNIMNQPVETERHENAPVIGM